MPKTRYSGTPPKRTLLAWLAKKPPGVGLVISHAAFGVESNALTETPPIWSPNHAQRGALSFFLGPKVEFAKMYFQFSEFGVFTAFSRQSTPRFMTAVARLVYEQ